MSSTQEKIRKLGQEVIDLLIEKNESYGDSALNPANVFASGNAVDNICCRIDDKLMRIKNTEGFEGFGEDNIKDLIGYLILLRIALQEEEEPHLKEWQVEILEDNYYQNMTFKNDSINS
tara:strand:- start:22509 stop:22865 length:357 start_codon:yes stop_codon:yes gene_type:complete